MVVKSKVLHVNDWFDTCLFVFINNLFSLCLKYQISMKCGSAGLAVTTGGWCDPAAAAAVNV